MFDIIMRNKPAQGSAELRAQAHEGFRLRKDSAETDVGAPPGAP